MVITDHFAAGSRTRFGLRAAGFALLLAALAVPALAREKEEEEEFDPRVYLETEDEASGLMRAAWLARENGKWRMAIEKYLEVARDYGHTVYRQTDRLYLPMQVMVRRELAGLPKEAKNLYKILKNREAEMAYRRALARGSRTEMEKISINYPCLPSAPRAIYLLGEWSRARGQAGRAIYYWQRLMVEYPDWSEAGRVSLLTRAALVAADAGRRAEGERLLAMLKKTSGLARLRVGSKELLVADEIARRLKSVGTAMAAQGQAGFWPSIGGGAAHDQPVARMVDAGVRQWKLNLGGTPKVNKRRNYGRSTVVSSTVPRRHPVSVGELIFLAGDTDVMAVQVESGQIIWQASKGRPNPKLPVSRMTLPAIGGGKVFVALGAPQKQAARRFGRQQTTFKTKVTLRAYAANGGKLKWESGHHESAKTKEFLRGVDLASTPVYDGGYVYCTAVKRGSISDAYMLCFDATDGRLVWKTFVCAGYPLRTGYYYNAQSVSEDSLPPAVSQGLVAFATNLGAVGVMDAGSGDPLWIYLYDRIEAKASNNRFRRTTTTKVNMWAPSAPIIKDGVLYVAPQDSRKLLALELTTGKVLWKSPRGKLTYLVGISGDALVCAGGKEVVAFSARTGKRLWRNRLADQVAGLGLLGRGFAVIPSTSRLQRFDLKTGKLKASYRFKSGSSERGNLVISDDVLISVGKTSAGGYYSWDEITGKLNKQIAAAPEAAEPRSKLGSVHFSAEKYREASAYFKAALARAKPGEQIRGIALAPMLKRQIWKSHSLLGKALEKGSKFPQALEDFREAHKYVQNDRERMTGHMRFARCRKGLKEWPAAAAEYQTVLARFGQETHTGPSGKIKVMSGPFAKAQIDRLIKDHGREVYARFDAEARELLSKATENRNAKTAIGIIDVYPNSAVVSPALVLLSEIQTAAGAHAKAAQRLREHLWKRPKSPRKLEVRARLALAYKAQGMGALSRSMMRRMVRSWKDQSFDMAGKTWTVKAFVEAHIPKGKLLGGSSPLPELGAPLITAWQVRRTGARLIPKASIHDLTGTIFLRVNAREVVAVDMTTGKTIWTKGGFSAFGGNNYMMSSLASSNAVVLGSGSKLVALAPATGQTLWESEILKSAKGARLYNQGCPLAAGEGVVAAAPCYYSREGRRNVQKSRVVVLDENSGKQIWSSKSWKGRTTDMLMAEGTLFVAGYDQTGRRSSITAYEIADGSKRFSAPLTGTIAKGQMTVRGDLLVVSSNNVVQCFDTATGKLKWRNSASQNYNRLLAVDDSRVVVVGYAYARGKQTVTVTAWDLGSGKKLWSSGAMNGYIQNRDYQFIRMGYEPKPAASTEAVMVTYRDRRGRKFTAATYDGKTGKLRWRTELPAGSYMGPMLVGRKHVATTVNQRGRVERRVWDLESGKLLEKKRGGQGFLTTQEGSVLQVTNQGVEKLVPKVKRPAPAPASTPAPAPAPAPGPGPGPGPKPGGRRE